jgi:hypothetical protein
MRMCSWSVNYDKLAHPHTITAFHINGSLKTANIKIWRRARDSNPRWALTHTPLAGARLQPLGQLSIYRLLQ